MTRIDDPSRFDEESMYPLLELLSAIPLGALLAFLFFLVLERFNLIKAIFLLPPTNG